jgi:hypothetical protein
MGMNHVRTNDLRTRGPAGAAGGGCDELSRFPAAAVDRELRMVALKQEINGLANRLGEGLGYPSDFERQDGKGVEGR